MEYVDVLHEENDDGKVKHYSVDIVEDNVAQISPFEVDHKPVEPAYGYKIEFNEEGTDKKIVISGGHRTRGDGTRGDKTRGDKTRGDKARVQFKEEMA